jgi:hypothetical protein
LLASLRGAHVTALDASAELLAIARQRLPAADVREGDLEALPFAESTFDAVTAVNSVFYAAEMGTAMFSGPRAGITAVRKWGKVRWLVPSSSPALKCRGAQTRVLASTRPPSHTAGRQPFAPSTRPPTALTHARTGVSGTRMCSSGSRAKGRDGPGPVPPAATRSSRRTQGGNPRS